MQRNENEKMLFELSQIDRLTSFYNRNRFIQDVSELKERKASVGVVYLDINGLKETNDSFGHDAGDKLIKACADIMKKSAASKNLYRIGGDEFVIIYLDIAKGDFYDKVQLLKMLLRRVHVRLRSGANGVKNRLISRRLSRKRTN